MGNKNDLLLSSPSALDLQVGGNHYKEFEIQPVEFCFRNNIPYLEATAIKYLCRWRNKGGIQDLQKAKHFIDILIQMETLYADKLDDNAEPLQVGLDFSDGNW
jgi:Protein of unknwon function (DUF3310)